MIFCPLARLLLCGICVLPVEKICLADERPTPAVTESLPDLVQCHIGKVSFQIDGSKLWTLSGIDYAGRQIASPDSAYGTVLNIEGVGLLGTAHFLDVPDQPGKIEKEIVTDLAFFVDGAPVSVTGTTLKLTGETFQMRRQSVIRSVHLHSRVSVRNNVLLETVRLQTDSELALKLSYPLMYAWSPTMTDFLFGNESGVLKRGTFLGAKAASAEGLERTAQWMAVYDAEHACGAVCLLRQKPESADVWFQYTDAPGVYRKLRLMSFSEKSIPSGFDGTFQAALGFFSAEKSAWEATAIRTLAELKEAAEGSL